ncbi:MAG TPA: alanine racemase, partial [Acidimicrobiales bacterium]|nr:alanine racemase [Acidimicrobiales bacterium]
MPAEGVHRPAWAEISRSALRHNVEALRAVLGATRLCAVVKANGYGHGATLVGPAALEAGADLLAVALVDEGLELRRVGVTAPILLLAEIQPSALDAAMANDLTLTVGSLSGAEAVVAVATRRAARARVHLKVDTGMHRMGVAPEEVERVVGVLASPYVDLEGVYTHFPVADGEGEGDRAFTGAQVERFDAVLADLAARGVAPRQVHLANSAGSLGYPATRRTLARVGLALYGYLPAAWLAAALEERGVALEPALTLRAQVVARRRLAAGERPSYGRRRELARASTVVTVPFGYADGYPRRLFEAGAEVLI